LAGFCDRLGDWRLVLAERRNKQGPRIAPEECLM
jgi:hypothetical protein